MPIDPIQGFTVFLKTAFRMTGDEDSWLAATGSDEPDNEFRISCSYWAVKDLEL
jgi:hypothetical protein